MERELIFTSHLVLKLPVEHTEVFLLQLELSAIITDNEMRKKTNATIRTKGRKGYQGNAPKLSWDKNTENTCTDLKRLFAGISFRAECSLMLSM